MNLPNKLTVLRMALVPVFVFFLLCGIVPHHILWAFCIFVAASITDALDGNIARKQNLVTNFGKFMDPLADKILVMSAMLCFVALGWTPAVAVIIILAREFLVTSLRLIAAGDGLVIAADKWGKLKTIFQMVWVCYTLLFMWISTSFIFPKLPGVSATPAPILWGSIVMNLLLWISVALTILSGVNYLWKNRKLIDTTK